MQNYRVTSDRLSGVCFWRISVGDFDDFAQKLQADHQAKDSAHAANLKREREERDQLWSDNRRRLEEEAVPVMKEAEAACLKLGLRPVIQNNWQESAYMSPQLNFSLFGPKKRPHDSSTYEVEANGISVRIEDGDLVSNVVKRAYKSRKGNGYKGQGVVGLREALKISIASYYEEISPE